MKKISMLNCMAIALILFVAITACKKEQNENHDQENTGSSWSVSNARHWFEKNNSAGLNSNEAGRSVSLEAFIPDWENALSSEDDKYYIIECPVRFLKPSGFSVKKAAEQSNTSVNGLTKLLVLKSKKSDFIVAAFMNVHSYSGLIDDKIRYKKPGNDFSGLVFYTDLDFNFINGWEYKNGKIVAETKQSGKTASNRAPVPEEDCYTYEIDTYERDCYYFANGTLDYCTGWQYVGTTTYTNCYSNGGGGGYGNQTIVTTSVNLEEYETNYTEEDYSSSGWVPINYKYIAEVARMDPGRQIVSVFVYPITADPMVSAYVSPSGKTTTRSLTLFNHYNYYTLLTSTSVMLNWSCIVYARYVYSDGTPSRSRQWDKRKSAIQN